MNRSLVHCVSVTGWCSAYGAAVVSPQGQEEEKRGQRRGSLPCTISIVLLLLFLCPLLRFQNPHAWITLSPMKYTYVCTCMHTHTHTFSYPQEWFMIPPLIPPGEQWLRVRGARRKDRVQYSEVKREECNDEQSGLQCFEEAADALCNRSLAEHELHDAQCRF